MSLHRDLTAARAAADNLARAARTLRGHLGDTVDVTRLLQDVDRVAADLDLIKPPAESPRGEHQRLEVIPDVDYPHDFWQDADDEGIGRR